MPSHSLNYQLAFALEAVRRQLIDDEQLATTVRSCLASGQSIVDAMMQSGLVSDALAGDIDGILHSQQIDDDAFDDVADGLFATLKESLDRVESDGQFTNARADRKPSAPAKLVESDRFDVKELHASGGLGEIFVANDKQLRRRVAIKRIRECWLESAEYRERFLREAEITARLEHPGVVPVYALGQNNEGNPYYAMRLIRGKSFRDAIDAFHSNHDGAHQANARLELRQLLSHLIDVCNTIEYAHSRGIIHRDIKPDNIMLGKYGETLVVDWGLAKFEGNEERAIDDESLIQVGSGSGSNPTKLGRSVGTPQYMSPEQAIGALHRINASSDVYCLGATLYHLLTGRPPHDAKDDDLAQRIEQGRFRRPHEIKATPAALESICLKAMSSQRHARYSSAADLRLDIERWLADESVVAHRESWPDRAARWMRKHRTTLSMAVVTLAVLFVGSFVGGYYWLRNQQLNLEMTRREETRVAAVRAQVASLDANAVDALKMANYDAAADMLQQAVDALGTESGFEEAKQKIDEKLRVSTAICTYYELSGIGRDAIGLEMDMRAFASLRDALKVLGVFEHGDWWAHLPNDYLNEQEKNRLQEGVYSDLLLLSLVRTKQLLMATVQEQLRNPTTALSAWATGKSPFHGERTTEEAIKTLEIVELAANYRSAVSTEWLRGFLTSIRDGNEIHLEQDGMLFRNSADALVIALFGAVADRSPLLQKVTRNPTAGDRDMVEEAFRIACALSPDNFFAHVSFASFLFTTGDHRTAQQYASQAIAIRPTSRGGYLVRSKALYFEARLLKNKNSPAASVRREHLLRLALQDTNRALQLAPNDPTTHSIHGDVAFELGDASVAAAEWAKHIELLRDNHLVSTFRFLNNFSKNIRREMGAAKRHYDPANPDQGILSLFAIGSLERRNYDKSIAYADELISLDPKHSFALAVRGAAQFGMGKLQAARADLEASLAMASDRFMVWQTLAELDNKEGYHEEALDRWKTARSVAVNELQKTAADFGMARTLVELERADEALELIRARFDQFPDAGWERLASGDEEMLNAILDIRKTWEALPVVGRTVSQLALLNGGFELGFDKHWSNLAGRPNWWNRAGSRSVANVTSTEKRVGEQSLVLRHRSPREEGAYSSTEQSIPVPADASNIRIRCWVKGSDVKKDAVYLAVGDDLARAIYVPEGTTAWQQVEATFPIDDFAGKDVKFSIVSQDIATVWLDELFLEINNTPSVTLHSHKNR